MAASKAIASPATRSTTRSSIGSSTTRKAPRHWCRGSRPSGTSIPKTTPSGYSSCAKASSSTTARTSTRTRWSGISTSSSRKTRRSTTRARPHRWRDASCRSIHGARSTTPRSSSPRKRRTRLSRIRSLTSCFRAPRNTRSSDATGTSSPRSLPAPGLSGSSASCHASASRWHVTPTTGMRSASRNRNA